MNKPFNKFEAIQLAEKIAYKEQDKFTALGYKPFLMLVDFEDLSRQGWWGYHSDDTDTITIDIAHWQESPIKDVLNTIQHEMVHMYVNRYHIEATYGHGPEFAALYEKIASEPYVHYAELYTSKDKYSVLTQKEKLERELKVKLGTIERMAQPQN